MKKFKLIILILKQFTLLGNIFNILYFFRDNVLTDIYGANVFKKYVNDNEIPIKVVSILVKTGISKGNDQISLLLNLLNDSIEKNPEFTKPDYIFENIYEFINHFDSNFINLKN